MRAARDLATVNVAFGNPRHLRDADLLAEDVPVNVAYVAMNFVHHLTNFRRLVCGCMDSYDSEQSHILQHFSSSTK